MILGIKLGKMRQGSASLRFPYGADNIIFGHQYWLNVDDGIDNPQWKEKLPPSEIALLYIILEQLFPNE